jgi:hypothetical protein
MWTGQDRRRIQKSPARLVAQEKCFWNSVVLIPHFNKQKLWWGTSKAVGKEKKDERCQIDCPEY